MQQILHAFRTELSEDVVYVLVPLLKVILRNLDDTGSRLELVAGDNVRRSLRLRQALQQERLQLLTNEEQKKTT